MMLRDPARRAAPAQIRVHPFDRAAIARLIAKSGSICARSRAIVVERTYTVRLAARSPDFTRAPQLSHAETKPGEPIACRNDRIRREPLHSGCLPIIPGMRACAG